MAIGVFRSQWPLKAGESVVLQVNGPLKVQGVDDDLVTINAVGQSQASKPAQWRIQGPSAFDVPRWAPVEVLRTAGPVSVVGLDSRLHISQVSGPVDVRGVDEADVNGLQGPLRLKGVRRAAVIREMRGALKVEGLPQTLQAENLHGTASLVAVGTPAGKRVVLHVRGAVALLVPAETRLHGRVQASSRLLVETADAPPDAEALEAAWEADDPSQALEVDIVAQGPDGRVYIGPQPPKDWVASQAPSWLQTLLGLLGGRGRKAETQTGGIPSAESETEMADNMAEARQRVLRLVAEGKVTAEEAEQLLEALER